MSFRYTARTVWIDRLGSEASPAAYDLCTEHADRFCVPDGWTLTDRRSGARRAFPRAG